MVQMLALAQTVGVVRFGPQITNTVNEVCSPSFTCTSSLIRALHGALIKRGKWIATISSSKTQYPARYVFFERKFHWARSSWCGQTISSLHLVLFIVPERVLQHNITVLRSLSIAYVFRPQALRCQQCWNKDRRCFQNLRRSRVNCEHCTSHNVTCDYSAKYNFSSIDRGRQALKEYIEKVEDERKIKYLRNKTVRTTEKPATNANLHSNNPR